MGVAGGEVVQIGYSNFNYSDWLVRTSNGLTSWVLKRGTYRGEHACHLTGNPGTKVPKRHHNLAIRLSAAPEDFCAMSLPRELTHIGRKLNELLPSGAGS